MDHYCKWIPVTNTSFPNIPATPELSLHLNSLSLSVHVVAGASGEERRLGRRRHVLRCRRLPPPPVPVVALAAATGAMVHPRPRRRRPRPLLPSLVRGVPRGDSLRRLHALHARRSSLRSPLRSLRHRRARPRLAPVTTLSCDVQIDIAYFLSL